MALKGTKITPRKRRVGVGGFEKCEITTSGGASIADVKTCAKVCGSHWFEPGTMRFFKSRVGQTAYPDGRGGAYFVSSEKPPHGPRAFSVRRYDPKKCSMETIGEFLGHATSKSAHREAKRLARRR